MLSDQPTQQVLFFWGYGPLLEACYEELCQLAGRMPDAILDSNRDKQGARLGQIQCWHPEILTQHGSPRIIITARKHQPIVAAIKHYQPNAEVFVVNFQMAYHKAVGLIPLSQVETPGPASLPSISFQQRWALVTGATKGIGHLLAMQLAELGLNLILVSRSASDLQSLAATLTALGRQVKVVAADLSTAAGLQHLLQHSAVSDQPVDLVFNNAAMSFAPRDCLQQSVSAQDMLQAYALNVVAPVAIAEHYLRLASQDRPVRIINVTSNADTPHNTAYTLTKAALNKYTFDSADLYAQQHAHLYLLDPGDVETPMNPAGRRPVSAVMPGALLPLYCRAHPRVSLLHATEFADLSLAEAISLLLHKYPDQWHWEPMS